MATSSSGKTILDDYAKLSLNDDEEEGLILQEIPENTQVINYSLCLVGSFLNQKKVNFGAMKDTLSSIWRPVKGVFMEETNTPNVFLFKFFHKLDVQRVLDDGPWTFNQQVLLVKRLEGTDQLSSVQLTDLYIWIQVYDLPIGFNSEFILKSIGDHVGAFRASDPNFFQSLSRSYLRIQVAIDVRKPLKSKMRIKKTGGTGCGYISNKGEERKYDSSFRAPMRRNQAVSTNQWLRGENGNMLNMITPDSSERMSEDGDDSGMQQDRRRDLRKPEKDNNAVDS